MTKDYINTITSLTMTLKRVKINLEARLKVVYWRVVGRSENLGGKQECGGHNLPPG